jgi:hypothetical protein
VDTKLSKIFLSLQKVKVEVQEVTHLAFKNLKENLNKLKLNSNSKNVDLLAELEDETGKYIEEEDLSSM